MVLRQAKLCTSVCVEIRNQVLPCKRECRPLKKVFLRFFSFNSIFYLLQYTCFQHHRICTMEQPLEGTKTVTGFSALAQWIKKHKNYFSLLFSIWDFSLYGTKPTIDVSSFIGKSSCDHSNLLCVASEVNPSLRVAQ